MELETSLHIISSPLIAIKVTWESRVDRRIRSVFYMRNWIYKRGHRLQSIIKRGKEKILPLTDRLVYFPSENRITRRNDEALIMRSPDLISTRQSGYSMIKLEVYTH
jgi:hypothetical protein